jgi:hypothetical protein
MAAYASFYGVGLTFQPVNLQSEFLKGLTLVGYMAFDGLLKSPGALFYFFGMIQQPVKG